MLRPEKNVHKFLLSSTSRFVGEYVDDDLLVTHAWPVGNVPALMASVSENSFCRNFYVVAIRIPETATARSVMVPDYGHLGDIYSSYLALLFGKRFDYHGLLETGGFFQVCDFDNIRPTQNPSIPINSHKSRRDLEIPLNLAEVRRLRPLFIGDVDDKILATIDAAGKFYLRSLRLFESDGEIAFLDLVTCGEILSNCLEFCEQELYDDTLCGDLNAIEAGLADGAKIAKRIKSRLFQVRRRYVLALTRLLNGYFFEHTESSDASTSLKRSDIEQRIRASYDLRSLYVHEGIRLGRWLDLIGNMMNEVRVGTPIVASKKIQKLLCLTPTYLGLERILRYCLLRFLHTHGLCIDERLGGGGLLVSGDSAQCEDSI